MKSIFDVLEEIERRPSMWVGETNEERGEQLRNLEGLLDGYAIAVRTHAIDEPCRDFPRQFAEYLRERFGWSAAAGAIAAIRSSVSTDEAAWELFFKLAREFRATLPEPRTKNGLSDI